jgi:hypothetical protein
VHDLVVGNGNEGMLHPGVFIEKENISEFEFFLDYSGIVLVHDLLHV